MPAAELCPHCGTTSCYHCWECGADVFAGDHRPGCESDPKANPPQLSPDERERLVKARAEVMALRADDGPWEEYTGPGR